MDEWKVTMREVREAFERLLEKVAASGCDPQYGQAIFFAQADVLDILAGKWDELEDATELEEGEPEPADAPRCAACLQTLREIERSGFACPTCYKQFGEEAVIDRLPF